MTVRIFDSLVDRDGVINDVKDRFPAVTSFVPSTSGRRLLSRHVQQKLLQRWEQDKAMMHERTRWDPERMDAWQLERVRLIVEHAFTTHPFYHSLYSEAGFTSGDLVSWDDYAALPTISKDDIIDNTELFRNASVLPGDDVYFSRTSGSSGRVLTILQDEATSVAGHMFYMRHYEQLLGRGRAPDEWLYEVYMCPQRYPELSGRYPSFTVDQECPVDLAFDMISKLRPAIVWSLPSYLSRLANEFGSRLSELGVSAVCTHSEGSTRDERRHLTAMFGAPVLDEYSSEELYLIGTECRSGAYHIVSDNVRVDVLQGDSTGQGEIVATSLTNGYMPFIRYRQGDTIAISNNESICDCGSHFARLQHFFGRSDQVLRRSDGSRIAPDHVMSAIDRTLLIAGANISEFRVVQDAQGAIRLQATIIGDPADGAGRALTACCAALEAIVGDELNCPISAECLDVMPQSPSYKRRVITSDFVPDHSQ